MDTFFTVMEKKFAILITISIFVLLFVDKFDLEHEIYLNESSAYMALGAIVALSVINYLLFVSDYEKMNDKTKRQSRNIVNLMIASNALYITLLFILDKLIRIDIADTNYLLFSVAVLIFTEIMNFAFVILPITLAVILLINHIKLTHKHIKEKKLNQNGNIEI